MVAARYAVDVMELRIRRLSMRRLALACLLTAPINDAARECGPEGGDARIVDEERSHVAEQNCLRSHTHRRAEPHEAP